MMSDQDLMKLIKDVQQFGEVSFKSSDVSADRQKLYRMKKAYEAEFPLLAKTWDFKIKHIKPNIINLTMKNNEVLVVVETVKKEETLFTAKPKRKPKLPRWIEKELSDDADAERQYIEKIGAVPKSTIEFFHTRRVAAAYYMELYADDIEDDALEHVIRHSREHDHVPLVLTAYGFAEHEKKPKTLDEQIIENARLIAESEPGPHLDKLVAMQERLRQRRDEELLKKDLLG